MPRRLPSALALLLTLAGLLPSRAQAQPIPAPDRLSDEAEVSLLTMLPGDEVYAEWGHSGIRVRDPLRGYDEVFNYGTFEFQDPLFLPKFVYGHLDYLLDTAPYPAVLRAYRHYRRPIIEQRLNLDAEQRQALFDFLRWNARPENRTYRYDFLFDNCSTRIRDVFEDTLGEDVRFAPRPDPGESFRELLEEPYLRDRPFLDLGFDLLLGTPTDQPATPREATFLPLYLMASFDHATIRIGGETLPLVARRDTVLWVEGRDVVEPALPLPALFGWLLFGLGLAATALDYGRQRPRPRLADALLFGTTGLIGLLAAFMWFVSEHYVTNSNYNLLWAWPTHLALAVALARRRRGAWVRGYLAATAAVALVALAGWAFWPQPLHPAVLPLVLLLALRSAWLASMPQPRRTACPARDVGSAPLPQTTPAP